MAGVVAIVQKGDEARLVGESKGAKSTPLNALIGRDLRSHGVLPLKSFLVAVEQPLELR